MFLSDKFVSVVSVNTRVFVRCFKPGYVSKEVFLCFVFLEGIYWFYRPGASVNKKLSFLKLC